MQIIFSKKFIKAYEKVSPSIQKKFDNRLTLFCKDQNNKILNCHGLHGTYAGYFSFNVTSDYRAIFEYVNSDKIELITIGTHAQLYK